MANIDEELRFLRDATDSDAIISRAAISEALKIINEDRAYPPRTLKATYNGEYETDPDHPYTKIEVEVNQDASSNLTVVPCFVITENGKYVAAEMFGKNTLITEFVVDVNDMVDKTPQILQVTSNGEYEAAEDEFYRNVIVNVPTAGHEGDLLTAEFYFFDPSDPNDMSLVYICKDEGILFGESALEFISRFPKFKKIEGDNDIVYVHDSWNPNPQRLTSNQLFIPTWDKTFTETVEEDVAIDFEIFMYLVNNDLLHYFLYIGKEVNVYDYETRENLFDITFRGNGIEDADGNKMHYCFSISANDPNASTEQYILNVSQSKWSFYNWHSFNKMYGPYIWTDGTDIYYSYGPDAQYVLDIQNNIWVSKTWYGIDDIYGKYIWTDGTDIYCSISATRQYYLDKNTETWIQKDWYGLGQNEYINGENIWTDGTNIYYSYGQYRQYYLDRSTSTWIQKDWYGLLSNVFLYGENIWTDGVNIFFSQYTYQYILDIQTSTWSVIDWRDPTDLTTFSMYGQYIWTDGINYYYSYQTDQYILDTQNISHQNKVWHGINNFSADAIWTDGTNIYYSNDYRDYKKPYFCQYDISDISSETPSSGDSYYWWGCSLVRALISHRRDYLVRENDIDVYDNCGWDLYNLIPQVLIDVIKPVSHYITHPKVVSNNYPYKHKTIPRKNLSIVQGPQTYQKVLNPSGNPQEQGWYTFDSNTKQFSLTSDTYVRSGTTYYFIRDSYTVDVDDPNVSDIFRENDWGITQASAWSDYDLNLKHSPILYINQENGRYKVYKKENLQLVEYGIQDHIKFVHSHLSHSTTDCYVRYWAFIGLRKKIKDSEGIEEDIPILMEDMYYITSSGNTNPKCVYLFKKDYKIYYTFNPRINDDTQAYNDCQRYEWNTDQEYITGIDNGIANGSNIPLFEKHTYTEGEHGYNKEFDVWPDEDVFIYATGNYFEKDGEHFIDPDTNDEYRVDVLYTLRNCNRIQDVYFYNYYDLANGYNSCIPAYHYVKQNGQYVLERIDTAYTGYNTENTEYYAQYVSEKVTDKFLTSTLDEDYHRKNDIYAPPYACYRYTDSSYNVRKEPNIINTHLLEFVDIVKTVELNQPNDKSITTDINYQYTDMFTYMSDMRNSNRNIYADEATIVDFEERERLNSEHPETYPLYTYEQASGIWQRYYNEFARDYSMLGPHNSYQQNGTPQKYNEIYFYL